MLPVAGAQRKLMSVVWTLLSFDYPWPIRIRSRSCKW
uniref:Uncharacterized protein n=1 Tax=Arundo donax TaxID=35708 RepID=A0A0A9HRU4_ARUDO